MESHNEKVGVFIDGGYISKVLKKYFNETRVDYLKLSNKICSDLNLTRLRTYFYHCLPLVRKNKQSDIVTQAKMERFLANIRRLPRFEVKLGKLQIIGNQFRQKMIDVLMSLDMTTMSYENQIQQAVLIAGDADFVPAIKKVKDYGIIVHLYYHPSSVHNELLDEIDELHKIDEELINSCRI